jgi:hypothetical protein
MLARGSARQLPLERDRDFRWRRIVVMAVSLETDVLWREWPSPSCAARVM